MCIEVGQRVKAKNDRVFEFAGHDPFTIWNKGQILWVQGVFQSSPGGMKEFMICLDSENFENVPEPIFPELFDLVE